MRKEPATFSRRLMPGIYHIKLKPVLLVLILCTAMYSQTKTAKAELPVTGVAVQELASFDNNMQSFMEDYGLVSGILGISKDGCIVYQRGFGYAYNMVDPLPENSPMRLASVEKPHTAAVILHLIDDGIISLADFVFDMDQDCPLGERRLLDARLPFGTYAPYDGVYGDARLADIRIWHLLNHQGGWDRGRAFCPFSNWKLLEIGEAVGSYPASPPNRTEIMRFMMSDSLQFDPNNRPPRCDYDEDNHCVPGDTPCYCDSYSNFGYMLLSMIIEQETGQQHTEMIRQRVYTPDMWVPSTEIIFGRDFRNDQSPREPRYIAGDCVNLFFPMQMCSCPYGGIHMEVKTGEGNLVGSAAPLLKLLDHYSIPDGTPITSAVDGSKNGGLAGTSTMIRQRQDGFNVVVLFNKVSGDIDLAGEMALIVYYLIDLSVGIDWSSLKCIDGFWIDFNEYSSGFGGHDDPFHSMDYALDEITDGTKLRIKPGTSNWNGLIGTRTLMDAPFGTVLIGQ